MIVSERDKVVAKTLIEVLNKAEFKLKGNEAIIVGRVMEWSAELVKRFEVELATKQQPVISEEPKDIVDNLQPKKAKKAK